MLCGLSPVGGAGVCGTCFAASQDSGSFAGRGGGVASVTAGISRGVARLRYKPRSSLIASLNDSGRKWSLWRLYEVAKGSLDSKILNFGGRKVHIERRNDLEEVTFMGIILELYYSGTV